MTRETKIGLLVGLAFIIVVGILLSEHLTTTTERPAAPLAEAGRTVQTGISAPGVSTTYEPPVAHAPEPRGPVPTAAELTPPAPGTARVSIVGPTGQQAPIVINDGATPPTRNETPVTPAPTGPIVTRLPDATDPFANDPLVRAAQARGEPIVPVGNRHDAATPPATAGGQTGTPVATNAREYKAQAGDTLSRIAALLPGGNTKANRDAVVKLNPTLQKDPNKIISGRTYLLPTQGGTASSTPTVTPPPVEHASVVEAPKPTEKPAEKSAEKTAEKPAEKKGETAVATRTYVVQKGDTLTKIATEQLGSAREVATIRKLNEDVLTGDVIKIDMKLKLPAKSVASSN